jgi:GTP1/Obg family GTP-binding protein
VSSPVHLDTLWLSRWYPRGSDRVAEDHPELDELQAIYRNAVDAWIAAIRKEEALASVNHTVAEVDTWEQAHLDEDEMRSHVKAAKAAYEDALREKFFGF